MRAAVTVAAIFAALVIVAVGTDVIISEVAFWRWKKARPRRGA